MRPALRTAVGFSALARTRRSMGVRRGASQGVTSEPRLPAWEFSGVAQEPYVVCYSAAFRAGAFSPIGPSRLYRLRISCTRETGIASAFFAGLPLMM